MLPLCPKNHLQSASQHEKDARNGLGHEIKPEPGQDLIGIIGAGNKLKQTAARNTADVCARRTEHPQGPVSAEIANFHKVEEAHSDVDEILCGWGVQGMIDKIGDICSKAPVVGAVFEKIRERHGSMREAMDKEGLQLSLCVMNSPSDTSRELDLLRPRGDREVECSAVDPAWLEVEEGVEEKRTEVFEEKDGFPKDLGAEVFEEEGCVWGKDVFGVYSRGTLCGGRCRGWVETLAVRVVLWVGSMEGG